MTRVKIIETLNLLKIKRLILLQTKENFSLKNYNTFGIDVKARYFVAVASVAELQEVLAENRQSVYLLGGGSNILLTSEVEGLVIKNNISGKEVVREDERSVMVSIGAGENWHGFVLWCLEHNYAGIENLSLIPGTVGAAPLQNIGAYGVELEDVFEKLEAVELETGKVKTFTGKECQFGYRNSIFKRALKGKYCITKVFLRLSKIPQINLSYGALRKLFAQKGIQNPSIREVSDAVIDIRRSKLPDPDELGNAGSFFKNPEIGKTQFEPLQKRFPGIVYYPLPEGGFKIPAGWLIEKAGWKGKRVGDAGCHANQALVLVNYGKATGMELKKLAGQITDSVEAMFGIRLKPEVNIW